MVTKEQLARDAEKPASLLIKDSATLERLAQALAEGDAAVQEVAAAVCRRVAGRGRWTDAAQADLVRALGVEHSVAVRSAALRSLRRWASIPLAGSALRQLISDDDERLREEARSILRGLGTSKAGWSEEVQRWAEESSGAARIAALDSYAVYHSLTATGEAWLRAWLRSDDEEVHLAAAGALVSLLHWVRCTEAGRMPTDPRFEASLRYLLQRHPDDFRRAAAAACLASFATPESTRCLRQAATEDAAEGVRMEACQALQSHAIPFEAARVIAMRQIERARRGDPQGRLSLHDVLELLTPHPEATAFILEELARETAPASSVEMLGWLGGRTCAASFEAIAEWVRLSPEELGARSGPHAASHRSAAIGAAAARPRDGHVLVPELLAILGDPERDATEHDSVTGASMRTYLETPIVKALTAIGTSSVEVRAALHAVYQRGDVFLRNDVVRALGELGADDDLTVDVLLDGLAVDNPYDPHAARDALVKLGVRVADRLLERRSDPARAELATRALAMIGALPSDEQASQESTTGIDLESHLLSLKQGLWQSGSTHALALALLAPRAAANSVVSPLSIALMLRFLGDVVGPEARAELPAWLGEGAQHTAVMRAVAQLRSEPAPEFRADMALFADPGTPVHREFEQRFDGHLDRVPLTGVAGVERINDWARQRSEGLIPTLLRGLPAQTRLVLVQLTYFSGRWMQPLTAAMPGATMSFHTAQRAWRPVACMAGVVDCRASQAPDVEAIELLYEPGSTALLLLIPADGTFLRFRARLDADGLQQIVDALADDVVSLRMPRFSVEADLDSRALSHALGLDALLAAPHLPGVTPLREDAARLETRHSARLRAHELGTDAAGATATLFIGCSARHLTIDRPFLFFLRHRETGVVLFAGQVTDPVDP